MEEQEEDVVDLRGLKFYPRKSEACLPTISQKFADSEETSSSASEMDPEVAKGLYEEGAFLIFLDVPERTEFGIDCNSWNVGEKFKGLKMIPAGVHFIYYSAVSKDNVTSLRTGFFHNFQPKEVLIKNWDLLREGLSDSSVTSEEQSRFESNLKNLDGFLGPYPYDSYKKWVSLSKWITEATVDRLSPIGPNRAIFSVQQLESSPFCSSRLSDEATGSPVKKLKSIAELPEMKILEHTKIRFPTIPERGVFAGSSAADITRLGMDKSELLEKLLVDEFGNDEKEILAETDFAFICFLIGQVFDAFEQWKKLVSLLCGCEKAILRRPQLFLDFITMIHFQLREIPKDFFVDIITRENFLTNTLQRFFAAVESLDNVDPNLRTKALKFRQHLQKFFKWDFTTELYEDAPVVVEF